MDSSFSQQVYTVIQGIPEGMVATYREVARAAGSERAVRAVGNILGANPEPGKRVPCHRVVKSSGEVGGYVFGTEKKIQLLQDEGVEIVNGKISLLQYGTSLSV